MCKHRTKYNLTPLFRTLKDDEAEPEVRMETYPVGVVELSLWWDTGPIWQVKPEISHPHNHGTDEKAPKLRIPFLWL